MKSSIACTAHSVRGGTLLLAAALAACALLCAPPAASRAETDAKACFSSNDQPWAGDGERFVREMLLKWRPDYAGLSVGELRIYIRDVLLGLEPPGERYAIETGKKGSILFEKKNDDIRCTIQWP